MYPMRVLLVFCLRGKEREINLHLLIHFPNGQGQDLESHLGLHMGSQVQALSSPSAAFPAHQQDAGWLSRAAWA